MQLDPCQTYVTLIGKRQFGIIQASTKARVDLGLVLPTKKPTQRLQAAGSFGSGRITHRIALASPDDVDEEVVAWIKEAYEADE